MTMRLFAGLVAGSVAIACSPTPQGSAPAAPAVLEARAPAAPATAPGTDKDAFYADPWSLGFERPANRGGTLTYATNTAPATLWPWGRNLFARVFLENTYDTLLARRHVPGKNTLEVEVICRLCIGWEVAGDRRSITFKLRDNVRFHDGQALTAEDVKFSYETALNPETGSEFRTRLSTIESMEAVDKQTLRIKTKEPDVDILDNLAVGLPIVSRPAFEGGTDYRRSINGTGPFKLEKFDNKTEFVAVRNPAFWLPERPALDRLVGRFISDGSTRASGFVARQLDILTTFDGREMEPIQKAVPNGKYTPYGGVNSEGWSVNLNRKPMDDVRVRRAMHLAVDRREISKILTRGESEPWFAPATPAGWLKRTHTQEELNKLPGFREPKDQDIVEARKLLADAGYPNGFKISATAPAGSTTNKPFNEAGADQLRKIGIDVTIDEPDAAAAYDREGKCDIDLFETTSVSSNSTLGGAYERYVTGAALNYCKWSNKEYDRLWAEQAREFDADKRWKIIKQLQTILLNEVPFIPFGDGARWAASHAWVHNWHNYGASWAFPWYPAAELIWVEPH